MTGIDEAIDLEMEPGDPLEDLNMYNDIGTHTFKQMTKL